MYKILRKNIFTLRFLKFFLLFSFIIFTFKGCGSTNYKYSSVLKFNCLTQKHGVIIPNTPRMRLYSSECNDYIFDKNKLGQVIKIFIDEYSVEFNISKDKMWILLINLKIEVSAIPRSVPAAFDVEGKKLTNTPVSGLALSKNKIWVEVKTTQIWSSALVHELIHIIIWRKNNVHGDPDHEGKEFSGWTKKHTTFIKNFNKNLLELEL